MVSRVQVAEYVADKLTSGRREALREAAAWLVAHGKARQARYLARDVAQVLADRGYVYAQVTTARPLTNRARDEVEDFIRTHTGARELELVTEVDPDVIGGTRIELPDAELDSTVRTKLRRFIESVGRDK
ncbi:MAG TPA: F0F1 ATP synthase subunit delta [Candidatus Saccharimonadia bacterium]|jgi:F0F1-type ATP synthase delta subunit